MTANKPKSVFDIMIVGVGGQGIVKLGQFFQQYSMECSNIYNMVAIESRGVSQREGSVYAIVRYALTNAEHVDNGIISPLPIMQKVDLMLALEPLEFLRNLHYLAPDGIVILNTQTQIPKSSIREGQSSYPDVDKLLAKLRDIYPNIKLLMQNFTESKTTAGFASSFSNVKMLNLLPEACPELFNTPEFKELQKIFFEK